MVRDASACRARARARPHPWRSRNTRAFATQFLTRPPPALADKKKVEAEAKEIPASERYSIRVDKQDDEILRHVLDAAQRHTGPQPQRLMRDQKKLHHLYGHLSACPEPIAAGGCPRCLAASTPPAAATRASLVLQHPRVAEPAAPPHAYRSPTRLLD